MHAAALWGQEARRRIITTTTGAATTNNKILLHDDDASCCCLLLRASALRLRRWRAAGSGGGCAAHPSALLRLRQSALHPRRWVLAQQRRSSGGLVVCPAGWTPKQPCYLEGGEVPTEDHRLAPLPGHLEAVLQRAELGEVRRAPDEPRCTGEGGDGTGGILAGAALHTGH